jgi:hypothetical protein
LVAAASNKGNVCHGDGFTASGREEGFLASGKNGSLGSLSCMESTMECIITSQESIVVLQLVVNLNPFAWRIIVGFEGSEGICDFDERQSHSGVASLLANEVSEGCAAAHCTDNPEWFIR